MSGEQTVEVAKLEFRVKFGTSDQELSRSVKHKQDPLIGELIAKL